MKKLPENYTQEEHAAWIRAFDRKERRKEIITNVIVYGALGLYGLYTYLNSDAEKQQSMWLWILGALAYWNIERRLTIIQETLDKIRNLN